MGLNRYKGWTVLTGLSIVFSISMALSVNGASVIYTNMVADLGWSRQALGALTSTKLAMTCVFAPVAALAIRWIGVRSVIIVGSLLVCITGVVMSTVVSQPDQAVLACALLGIATALAGAVPCLANLAQWFVRRRTMAISILYAAMGVASVIAIMVLNALISSPAQWRLGWWVFIGGGLVSALVGLFILREAPAGEDTGSPELLPAQSLAHTSQTREFTVREAMSSPLLWCIFLTLLTLAAGNAFLIAHGLAYLHGAGFSSTAAASAISLSAIGKVLGSIGFGFLAIRMGLRKGFVLTLLVFSCGLLLLAEIQGNLSLVLFSLVEGLGFGAGTVAAMSMLGHYWGTRVYPALSAGAQISIGMGGGIAPVLAGSYFDAHQTYVPVIYAHIATTLAVALLLCFRGLERQMNHAQQPS